MQNPEPFPRSVRFTFRKRLGEGGFGVVYEADDRERGTRVALKTLHHLDATALYAFKREFRALSDVHHPNLISLHELISEGDQWFFTMDLVEGTNFLRYVRDHSVLVLASTVPDGSTGWQESGVAVDAAQRIRDESIAGTAVRDTVPRLVEPDEDAVERVAVDPDRWPRLRSALRQLAEGLCALHAAGKLHRDLKPSNVLVTQMGKVVILDFGIAMDVSADPAHPTFGHMAGTPAYMSPQQASGEAASTADDWYSVGVMLYEALTGRLPFTGEPLQVLVRKQREDPPPPNAVAATIPADLDDLCMGLLRRNRGERLSGADVLKRLAAHDGGAAAAGPLAAPEPSIPSRAQDQDNVPFIGRQKHLAALRTAFDQAKGGRATTVHVRGVSGMGKSALVRHFLHQIESRNEAVILQGRCYERESVPYKAVDNLIDSLSRYLSRLPETRAMELLPRDVQALLRLFPVLGRVRAVAAAPSRGSLPPDAQEMRRRGFAALRELLGRMADRQPVIVHIDDLQWGDADSALLLGDLLREPDPPALLLLLGYRSEDADRSDMLQRLPASVAVSTHAATDGPGSDAVRDLVVGPLDEDEARALVLNVLGGTETTEQVDAIVREAAGSPFFVQQLARAVRKCAAAADEEIRLATVFRDHLARLPAEANSLLEIVAVAGKPISRRVARDAAGLSPEQERAAMVMLCAEYILRSRGMSHEEELETFHDRIRETAVGRLEPDALARLHFQLATALEASGTAEPDMLALHFRRAQRPGKAAPYAILAGDRAADALAFDRAAALFGYVLETAPGDAVHERALRIKLGDALANAGHGVASAEQYSVATQGALPDEALDLRRRAAEQLLKSGHLDKGKAVLAEVLASVGITLFQRRWLVLLSLFFWRFMIWWRGFRRRTPNVRKVPAEIARRLDACWSAAIGLSMCEPVQSAEFHARYLALALHAGDLYHLGRALALEVVHMGTDARNQSRADQTYRASLTIASKLDNRYLAAFSELARGVFELQVGQWVKSLKHLQAAEAGLSGCGGVAWELATTRTWEMIVHSHRCDFGAVRQLALACRDDAEARGDLYTSTWYRVVGIFYTLLAADRPDSARHEVLDAMSRWPQRGFDQLHFAEILVLGRADVYSGTPLEARARLRHRLPDLVNSEMLRTQILRGIFYDIRASAALAAAAMDAGSDRRLFEELLREADSDARRLSREQVPWLVATSNARLAGVASLRGDMEAALALLDIAASQYDACDMASYTTAVRRRKGEIIGGNEGHRLVKAADAFMAQQGIVNPARMTALLVPGFR
ncbi:MAG: protein kinase [Minicystis sp.]